MSSAASFGGGQLGFVLIPKHAANLFQRGVSQQRMYWPALLFPSHFELLRSIPSPPDSQSFQMEWKYHEVVSISDWKRKGLLTPDDGPVRVALLLGSEVPPCATRTFPICPQDVAAVAGGALYKPYVFLSKRRMDEFKELEGYAGNHQFLDAMGSAEQYLNTKEKSTSIWASLKWPDLPDGLYYGADPHEYAAEGWLWWNGDWHRVPALPSETELERMYPTHPFCLKAPKEETYAQKVSRIFQMQLLSFREAQERVKSSISDGTCEHTYRKREMDAQESLSQTGEMHLYKAVMAKICELPKGSQWGNGVLNTIIHQSRKEWKNRNTSTDCGIHQHGAGAIAASPSVSVSTSPSPEPLSNHEKNDTASESNPALLSAASLLAAAPTRITPDKPQDHNKSADGASSTSDDNTQPKPKKQKRSRREVSDLVIPGSLPREGIEWEDPVQDMSLACALSSQQPARTVICNDGKQAFYGDGTGIEKVEMHFLPKNVRFPNDAIMNQAAINARTVVARVFGGDELIGQRDRKYSSYQFNTVSLTDMTVSPTNPDPLNKCMGVLYFSQVENARSLWIEWFATAVEYRGKKIGIGILLLESVLDLAIVDGGIDHVYLEVGRDKEGEAKWKAARSIYHKVGFNIVQNDPNLVPNEVVEYCKHFDDSAYDIMRFECAGKRPKRKSTRRRRAI
jgi:hypothetical protein